MAGKIFLRLVGTLTCMAVVAIASNAEACGHRHHRRACCAPVCCDPCYTAPSCCAPVCETACAPVCVSSCAPSCCYRPVCGYTVVREEVILSSNCCTIAATTAPAAKATANIAKPTAKSVSLSR